MNDEIKVRFQRGMRKDAMIFHAKVEEAFQQSENCVLGDYLTLFQVFTGVGMQVFEEKEKKLAREFDSSPKPITDFVEEIISYLNEKLKTFTQICNELDNGTKKIEVEGSNTIQ